MMASSLSTINQVLKYWAETRGEKECFSFFDRNGRQSSCRAGELYLMAGRFALRLRQLGFKSGDVISNSIPNSPERLVTDFGILLAGCATLHCQVVEKDGADFWNTVQLSKCMAIILPVREFSSSYSLFKQFMPQILPKSGNLEVSIPNAPDLKRILLVDRDDTKPDQTQAISALLSDLRQSNEDIFDAGPSSTDLAYILTTSGSTGYCKLVPRTHHEMLLIARAFKSSEKEVRFFNDRPLGWAGGLPFHFFRDCSPLVLQDCFDGQQTQDAKEMWQGIQRENCGMAFLLPSQIVELLEEFKDNPPDFKLLILVTSGQPVKKVVVEAIGVLTKFIIISYASTEAAVISNLLLCDKNNFCDFLCGSAFNDVQIRVVDEQMRHLQPGSKGTILLKSSTVFRHYYNQTPATPVFTPDNWFITGDCGWINDDGYLFVTDKQDDVINHGAILVYPSWPESILLRCSGVKEAAVMGIPDSTGASKLCACIELKVGSALTKEGLGRFYKDSFMNLSRNEYIPTLTYIEFFDTMPKTFNGKISKEKLRRIVRCRINSKQ